MSLMNTIISSTFIIAMAGLVFCRTHLLSALLCLEMMMLSLFVGLATWTLQLGATASSLAPMLLLALSACEASAGLALLVATTRTHGSNRMQSLHLLQC
uniref:NADH-ubiquinone oxidoreductase chain 4L n=1 Tax=Trichonotus filamentosus TaxID=1703790 RepID=A0A348B0A5_9TELE|nr:NADH dehydrogenase subunit 4L [Trichonotus filamentosus]